MIKKIFPILIIFLLFVCITIPMMEKRQISNKHNYQEYIYRTNMLLPVFKPTEEEIRMKKEKKVKK